MLSRYKDQIEELFVVMVYCMYSQHVTVSTNERTDGRTDEQTRLSPTVRSFVGLLDIRV